METKINKPNPYAHAQQRAGQNNTLKLALTALGSAVAGAAVAGSAATGLYFVSKWHEGEEGEGGETEGGNEGGNTGGATGTTTGGNENGGGNQNTGNENGGSQSTSTTTTTTTTTGGNANEIQPVGPENGEVEVIEGGNGGSSNGGEVVIENIENVNPDDIAIEIIDEVDPNDNDVATIFEIDDIGTVYNEAGEEMTAALAHTPDGEQFYMIDSDNDNTFDCISDTALTTIEPYNVGFTVSDAELSIDNSGGYMEPTTGDETELAMGDNVTDVDVVDTDGETDIAMLDRDTTEITLDEPDTFFNEDTELAMGNDDVAGMDMM